MRDVQKVAARLVAGMMSNESGLRYAGSHPAEAVEIAYRMAERILAYPASPGPSGERGDYRGESLTDLLTPSDTKSCGTQGRKGARGKEGSSRFKPPSLREVADYVAERQKMKHGRVFNPMDVAQAFIDHYDSNNWRVGRNPMKNWQAAVRNWMRREGDYTPKQAQQERPRRPLA